MKLFKKAAALFFCLALALSVMAVTALADDEVVLLDTTGDGVNTITNDDFEVLLTKSTEDTANNVNVGIVDRDNVSGYEINPSDKVTFDITLGYTGSAYNVAGSVKNIDGFQFDFIPANNYGAEIDSVKINGATISHVQNASDYFGGTSSAYENIYAYSSAGDSANDIALPTCDEMSYNAETGAITGGMVIGTITLKFNGAAQAVNIYPQIENLLIHVRNTVDSMQRPVGVSTSNTYNNYQPAGTAGTITGGRAPSTGGTTPGAAPNNYTYAIVAPVPVIVNPVYDVTLEQFANNSDTGIIAKIATTTTLQYDFLHGTINGDATTILTNTTPSVYGYKLQGWMVTANPQSSSTWTSWTDTTTWDKTTSYQALTSAMSNPARATSKTAQSVWSDAALTRTGNASVMFIAVNPGTSEDVRTTTEFWPGQVGNITLTPVYTRIVYTATFNSYDDDATFGSVTNDTLARVDNDNDKPYEYSVEYTIEDLYDTDVVDFLSLNDGTVGPVGPQGLTRKAYKFMGWTVTNDSDTNSGYTWKTPDKNSVDGTTSLLTTATAKHYGDVKFTAFWEEDVYFAKVAYQYAGTSNALILVGVPNTATDNYDKDYTYLCNGEKMFIVSDAKAQRALYVTAANSAVSSNPTAGSESHPGTVVYDCEKTSDFNDTAFGASSQYIIFAYIASTANTDVTDITIDEAETNKDTVATTVNSLDTKCANYALRYDGDVDVSGGINVGDFANVDTLLNADNANVFAITGANGWYGVRARLEAHVDTTTTDNQGRKFASIGDVKTIYGLMGYDTNGT